MVEEQGQLVEMVADARSMDQKSLSHLYESCYPKVYRYMYLRVRHRELAEDLTSDVMLRIVRSLRFYHQRGVPVEAWIYRIAANRLRDHLRRDHISRTARLSDRLARTGRDGVAESVATWHDLRMALSGLSKAQQQVLALRYLQGLSIEETAQIMGRTSQSIKSLSHRAQARLRSLAAAEGPPMPTRTTERPNLGGQKRNPEGAGPATSSREAEL